MKKAKRDEWFNMRMSKAEKQWVINKSKETGLNFSDVIRKFGLNKHEPQVFTSGHNFDFLIGQRVYVAEAQHDELEYVEDMIGIVEDVRIEDYYFFEKNESIFVKVYIQNEEDGFTYHASLDEITLA